MKATPLSAITVALLMVAVIVINLTDWPGEDAH